MSISLSRPFFRAGVLLVGLMAMLPAVVHAQAQTGSIYGTVTDNDGSPLPGVAISISSPAFSGIKEAVSRANGRYVFRLLPPGNYMLNATMMGMKTVNRSNIRVAIGHTTTVPITMMPATAGERR